MSNVHYLQTGNTRPLTAFVEDVNSPIMERLIGACCIIHYQGHEMPPGMNVTIRLAIEYMGVEFVDLMDSIAAIPNDLDNNESLAIVAEMLVPLVQCHIKHGRFEEVIALKLIRLALMAC